METRAAVKEKNLHKRFRALSLRREGLTLREIGADLGLSANRVRYLIREAERIEAREHDPPEWYDGLSLRTANALRINEYDSRAAVREAYEARVLKSIPNVGKKTINEIADWLGLPRHKKEVNLRKQSELSRLRMDALPKTWDDMAARFGENLTPAQRRAAELYFGEGVSQRDLPARLTGGFDGYTSSAAIHVVSNAARSIVNSILSRAAGSAPPALNTEE